MISLGIVKSSQRVSKVMSLRARSELELSLGPSIILAQCSQYAMLHTCLMNLWISVYSVS